MKPKVLLVTAPIGAGHLRAAAAVAAALNQKPYEIPTKIINVFDLLPPSFGRTIINCYLKILKTMPQIYGMMYGWGNTSNLALKGREFIYKCLARRMAESVKACQPAIIVCTHALSAGLVAALVKTGQINVPVIGVITDYVVHRLWIYPELTHYFVASEDMRQYLAKHGIPPASCTISGIPIAAEFGNLSATRQDIAEKLGLAPDIPTILLMGGGAGVLPMEEILTACDNLPERYQFIAVAGRNRNLYYRLLEYRDKLRQQVSVFGYVDNIHELMLVADILVSKPGGLTSAEALASGLPLIIYRPIPGQEEANTRYLLQQNVAVRANSPLEVKQLLALLLRKNSPQLAAMQAAAKRCARPEAATTVAAFITRQLGI